VSILLTFSKIYERVVNEQLLNYLEENNILDDQQHGFRPGRSTTTACIDFIQQILDEIDKGNKPLGLFIDLAQAFESVIRNKLIEILRNFGLKDKEISWFCSYLTDRLQYVELSSIENDFIRKFVSKLKTSKYGVPQGSILGPLLFLCYITGLPGLLGLIYSCLYADDANVIISESDLQLAETTASNFLNLINTILSERNLLLNPIKTQFISFRTQQSQLKYKFNVQLGNQTVSETSEAKFLGLIIDQNLSWNQHVELIVKKVSSGLYALKQMSKICNQDTLKQIYYALIHSHINYGIGVYGATTIKNPNKILKLQKKAIRIILNLKWNSTVKHFIPRTKNINGI